jgi:hypothetical protein
MTGSGIMGTVEKKVVHWINTDIPPYFLDVFNIQDYEWERMLTFFGREQELFIREVRRQTGFEGFNFIYLALLKNNHFAFPRSDGGQLQGRVKNEGILGIPLDELVVDRIEGTTKDADGITGVVEFSRDELYPVALARLSANSKYALKRDFVKGTLVNLKYLSGPSPFPQGIRCQRPGCEEESFKTFLDMDTRKKIELCREHSILLAPKTAKIK